jgi:3-keto-L-gulonate-6-phosphate decarboxylase
MRALIVGRNLNSSRNVATVAGNFNGRIHKL